MLREEVVAARAALGAGRPVDGEIALLAAAKDEQGEGLSENIITTSIMLLLFAGHDTTTTAICDLLCLLHSEPRAFARLREEQSEVVAAHGPQITPDALRGMRYAEAAVREGLRMRPVAVDIARVAAADLEICGRQVAAGTQILLPMARLAGQDPLWSDATGDLAPGRFNPDRFLDHPEAAKSPWQMPFGHGPRFCLGYHLGMLELKTFLALLARGYDFTVDGDTEFEQTIGRRPKNGLPMVLTPRGGA
ncbi:MAG: cytochrome P450 [Monoraphidium minutum]|nr:MAG: cytochrome P450 [Monoraphidium minutum]